ncbi:LysR family transcriptional regulator [Sulfitobacter aestuarii]|uniref:LysR family transcriptional regulator n=1 Tax=Sulfitobacter aestuarii TaxID=2161676 RepID=A0ABW5U4P3_9RHOB
MSEIALENLPLEWIRAFEAAGRSGSFTAAAQELNLTQAAISQRITHLEARIGSQLFIRKPRGVALSVEGESWLPYVSNALGELAQSYEDIFGLQRDKIRISASASITALWLAPRLARWSKARRAQIVFSTMVLQSESIHREASVRVEYGRGDWPDHHAVPLFQEALSPVAAPHLMAETSRWQDLPRISVSGPRQGWQEWARHSGDPTTPVPQIRFDSFSAALAAVVCGAGVLLASLPLCDPQLRQGRLMRLSEQALHPAESYWMIARKRALPQTQWKSLAETFTAPLDEMRLRT